MGLDNPIHIAFILIIVLLVFGAKRLPELGRSLGTGMREFKDSLSGDSSHMLSQSAQQPQAPVQPVAAQAPAPAPPQPVATPTPEPAPDPQAQQPAQAQPEPTHQA